MSLTSPTLSVIVPVFNEQAQLEGVVRHLQGASCPVPREWLFIDDCSTDGSRRILHDLEKEYGFRVIEQPENRGKGAAVRRGVREATGEFIMIQDADFEYEPNDIADLMEPLLSENADVVYGSRFKKSSMQVHRTYHYFVNRILTLLSNLVSGIYLTDMETCYKVFRADLIKSMRLTSNRFGIEVELTAYLAKTTARVFELPIRYYPRSRLQGKKIGWRDGIAALWHIVSFNLLVSTDEAFDDLPDRYRERARRYPPGESLYDEAADPKGKSESAG